MCSDREVLTALARGAITKHDIQVDAASGGLLVDTSIVHAVLYMQGMQQSIVRERRGAHELYICFIVFCARLQMEPARAYLVKRFPCSFLGLVLTPGLRAGRTTKGEAQLLGFTVCRPAPCPQSGRRNKTQKRARKTKTLLNKRVPVPFEDERQRLRSSP